MIEAKRAEALRRKAALAQDAKAAPGGSFGAFPRGALAVATQAPVATPQQTTAPTSASMEPAKLAVVLPLAATPPSPATQGSTNDHLKLQGMSFCFTGELEAIPRVDAEDK